MNRFVLDYDIVNEKYLYVISKPVHAIAEYIVKYDIANMNRGHQEIIKFINGRYQPETLKFMFLSFIIDEYTTIMAIKD